MDACLLLHDQHLASQYITDVNKLLSEFSWVYDWKLTRFFVDRVWERCPVDWLQALLRLSADQLSQIASSTGKSIDLPSSLRHYIDECRRLSIVGRSPEFVVPCSSLPTYQRRKISAKKQHEFDQLLPMLADLCNKHQISQIVDIGCGIVST